jgi:hypothetical protein
MVVYMKLITQMASKYFAFYTEMQHVHKKSALGPSQPHIQRVPGTLPLGVERLGREADHSPPSSAEVKNAWNYTSTPQYIFMAWCLVKHRDFSFTFYLLHKKSEISQLLKFSEPHSRILILNILEKQLRRVP